MRARAHACGGVGTTKQLCVARAHPVVTGGSSVATSAAAAAAAVGAARVLRARAARVRGARHAASCGGGGDEGSAAAALPRAPHRAAPAPLDAPAPHAGCTPAPLRRCAPHSARAPVQTTIARRVALWPHSTHERVIGTFGRLVRRRSATTSQLLQRLTRCAACLTQYTSASRACHRGARFASRWRCVARIGSQSRRPLPPPPRCCRTGPLGAACAPG
jgi:hypothetical protein